jgi:NAD(P)-dependent dehydrogenase (short-subunit alcohol dehydrogenase family)
MDNFEGKTAVVTGAASGLGLALASRLADLGARIVLADRDVAALATARDDLVASGAEAVAAATDVARPESVDRLADTAEAAFGHVHLLANNAGILRPGSTWEQPIEDWEAVFGVNVYGIVHGLRTFVPRMLAHGEPCHVLNTASVGGLLASPYMAAYIASKHAAVAISECLALEVADSPMGVTVLCPGGVATSIYRREVARRAEHGTVESEATTDWFDSMADPDRGDQASPDEVAAVAIEAIRAGRLYAPTFNDSMAASVRARLSALGEALDQLAGDGS